MAGILRLENLTTGNTLRQGDLTLLKYRLFDADGDKLDISGKPATIRLMKNNFTFIAYEKEGLTVAPDDTISFNVNKILPAGLYHLEVIVDDKYIFPSRDDEGEFNVDKSTLGADINIVEATGVEAVARKATGMMKQDDEFIDDMIANVISDTNVGNIEEYYNQFNEATTEFESLKTQVLNSVTKSQNALNVANGIDAKATNALSLSTSADILSKSVQEQFNQVVIDGDSSVESAQARVNTDGVTKATLKERLDDEHNEVTEQLAQGVRGVPLSSLGGIPNDSGASNTNAMIIKSAISDGKALYIDGVYYVGNIPDVIHNDIYLSGNSNDSKIIMTANVFTISDLVKNIHVNGIAFESEGFSKILFINDTDKNVSINELVITNNTFSGYVSLARFYGLKDTNPTTSWYGVRKFSVRNNKAINIYNSLVVFADIPFDFVDISNNIVRNFYHTLFSFGVDSAHLFDDEVSKNQLVIKYDHNHVTCDDSWWCPESAMYHCALLCESISVTFTNNHTEGLKSLGNIALYDGYLSSENVIYENNVWKNNVIFNANMIKNNTLMKSKAIEGTNIFRNNTFTMDRDLPARLGQSEDLVSTFLYGMASLSNWIVENNHVDVIRLRTMTSSHGFKDLTIRNNVIKAKYLNDTLVFNNPSSNPFQYSNTVIIEGNNIYGDSVDPITNNSFQLSNTANGVMSQFKNTISVCNNEITAPNINHLFLNQMADKLTIEGNKVFKGVSSNEAIHFMLGTKANKLISYNNLLLSDGATIVPQNFHLGKAYMFNIKAQGVHTSISNNRLYLPKDNETNGILYFSVTSQGINGVSDFTANAKITTNESGQKIIVFTAEDDIEYTSVLGDGTNTNKRLKLIGTNEGAYKIVFYNKIDEVFLYLAPNGATEKIFEIDAQLVTL